MKSFSKYWAITITQVQNSAAYPGELIGRSLIILPFMWIFYQLWRVTFASTGTNVINGLNLHGMLWYLMLTETIELSRPRLGNTISEAVKDGSIAYTLSKPYNFLLYHFSNSAGETIFRAAINAILGGAVVWWLVGPPPAISGWPFVILAMLGAWLLNFCISAMIGLAAFIMEDINALQWIFQKMSFILGGLLVPLDFYPAWLQNICKSMPFSAMSYEPARLFVDPSIPRFIHVLGLQIAWILPLALLLHLAFKSGTSRLAINGG